MKTLRSRLALLAFALLTSCGSSARLNFDAPAYRGLMASVEVYSAPDMFGSRVTTRLAFSLDAQGNATVPIDDNIFGFGAIQVQNPLTTFASFPLFNGATNDQFISTVGALQSVRILLRRQVGSSSCYALIDQVVTAQGVSPGAYDASQFDTQPCANFRP